MIATLAFNFTALLSTSLLIYAALLLGCFCFNFLTRSKITWNDEERASFRIGMIAALPVGISAVVLGFLSGLSYEPSISALITGVISLVSGSAVYLFSKDRDSFIPISLSILMFSLNLLGGSTLGAATRDRALVQADVDARNRLLSDAINTSIIESRVITFRKNLGLDADVNHLGIANPPIRSRTVTTPPASDAHK
jgi:hypothetical protein